MKKEFLASLALAFIINALCLTASFATEGAKLVTAVESEKAYLYAAEGNKFIIKYKDLSGTFAWEKPDRRQPPEMRVFDYDQDGEKEIAVSLYLGGGTGLHIEHLYVVKTQNGKLADYVYKTEDCAKAIRDAVSFSIERQNKSLFIKYASARDSLRFDITKDVGEDSPDIAEMKLECGDVISFSLEDDGTITLKAALGAKVSSKYSPDYYADLTAKVLFARGGFTLSDIRIAAFPN